jgi:hypothetical protein
MLYLLQKENEGARNAIYHTINEHIDENKSNQEKTGLFFLQPCSLFYQKRNNRIRLFKIDGDQVTGQFNLLGFSIVA